MFGLGEKVHCPPPDLLRPFALTTFQLFKMFVSVYFSVKYLHDVFAVPNTLNDLIWLSLETDLMPLNVPPL